MNALWILVVVLSVSNLALGLMLLKAIFQRDDLRETLRAKRFWHSKLADFVFEYAKFPDAKGISDAPNYDSKQVESKWEMFHSLVREFREAK